MTLSKCEDSAHAQLLRKLEAIFLQNLIFINKRVLSSNLFIRGMGVTFKNKDMSLLERGFL